MSSTRTTMRAARIYGNRDVRVDDVPIPTLEDPMNGAPDASAQTQETKTTDSITSTDVAKQPLDLGDGGVKSEEDAGGMGKGKDEWKAAPRAIVEIEWCGICGSDLHEFDCGPIGIPTKQRPHPLTNRHMPTILGHELCGTISSALPDSRFRKGQKVMVDPRLTCHSLSPHGPCVPCTTNRDNQCPKLGFVGYSGSGGGFSEYVAVEEKMLYEIPDSVPLEYAALVEPLAVAHHAIKMTGWTSYKDKSVLIVGGGPVGYAVILALRAAGCKKILVSEPTSRRREEVGKLVEAVVDPRSENVGAKCRELTDGRGVDVNFDCAGVQKGLEAGIDALTLGGWWVNISLWDNPMTVPFWKFMAKEVKMTSSFCYNDQDFREVMENVGQGKYPGFEKMVTGRISLEDVVSKGFTELIDNKDEHVKILVTPKKELLK